MWYRIAQMQWAKDSKFDYKAIAQRCFLKWGKEEMGRIETFAREKVETLYAKIEECEKYIQRKLDIGSDDGMSDCLWHIVGLGKTEYLRSFVNPFLIEKRANLDGYTESFAYCFHNPNKWSTADLNKIYPICWKCSNCLSAKNKSDNIVEFRLSPLVFKGCSQDSRITWDNRNQYCPIIN